MLNRTDRRRDSLPGHRRCRDRARAVCTCRLLLCDVAAAVLVCGLATIFGSVVRADTTSSQDAAGEHRLSPLIPRPPARAAEVVLPVPKVNRLKSGVELWTLPWPATELVTVAFMFQGGAREDPPGKPGVAHLTALMMSESSGERSSLEVAAALDSLGATFSVEAGADTIVVRLQVLERNLPAALEIVGDSMRRPAFAATDWQRVRDLWANGLQQRQNDPHAVAAVVSQRLFFGADSPYFHPVSGVLGSVDEIELDDIKGYARRCVRPGGLTILATGGSSADRLLRSVAHAFEAWSEVSTQAPPTTKSASESTTSPWQLALVERPGAPQTVVRILVPAPLAGTDDLPPLVSADLIFGGMFTSRLSTNLRQKHQLTYGASSSLRLHRDAGYLAAGAAVEAPKTARALAEFFREFRAIASIQPAELAKAQAAYRSRVVRALETQLSALSYYSRAVIYGLGPQYRSEFFRQVERAELDAVVAAAARRLNWRQATLVLIGDRAQIEAALTELADTPPPDLPAGFELPEPTWYDAEGRKINAAANPAPN